MIPPRNARHPRLLICEGEKDKLFFHQFIEERGLPRFHIRAARGKDKLGEAILAYQTEPKSNWPSIGRILIVGDNDDLPTERFQSIRDQINDLFPGTAPARPLIASTSRPSCTVLMMPETGVAGTLECLLKDAASSSDAANASACHDFLAACHHERWASDSRSGMAWLRSNLAVRCQRPFVPLGEIFTEAAYRPLIPLNHRSLNPLAEFLATFA